MNAQPNHPATRMRTPLLLPTGRDADLVGSILAQENIAITICASMTQLLDRIRNSCGPFVVGDEALTPQAIDDLMAVLDDQPDWSVLPGIVLTGQSTRKRSLDRLMARREISLIQRPVQMALFVNLVRTAIEARHRQYQVKDLLQSLTETNAMLRSRTDLLQKLSLELNRAENQERRRIADLLHDDLQQMLASARLQTELLLDDVDRMAAPKVRTIYDILSKAMEGARSLSHELNPAFAIGGNLAEALNRLGARMAESYGFEVQCHIDIDSEAMDEDIRIFIYRSIQELFFNCAKHARADRVSLEVAPQENALTVTITDDGVGIDPESLTILGGGEGGFGLFSIKERATALGGAFHFQSAPNQGSRITLTIPFGPLSTAAPERLPNSVRDTIVCHVEDGGGGMDDEETDSISVIIADDHAVMRQGLATLLRTIPAIKVVAEAADGEQAVALALRFHPEVVLMDYSMPHLNGAEATRQIKRTAPEIAVIGLSMYGDRQTRQRMLEAGAEAYMSKDVQAGDLVEVIRQCADRSAASNARTAPPAPDAAGACGHG